MHLINIKEDNHKQNMTLCFLSTMVKYLIHGLYDRRISMKIALFLLTFRGSGHRMYLSPPVLMHSGLICLAFCLYEKKTTCVEVNS